MNRLTQAQEDILLDYLDGNIAGTEKARLEDELRVNALLRSRLDELRSVHTIFQHTTLEQPTRDFTDRVMQKLDTAPAPTPSRWSIRNAIFLLIGVLTAIGAASLLIASGVFDGTTSISLDDSALPQTIIKQNLPALTLHGKLIVNIIIMLNIIVGWILLDRAILRPYFQRRMQA
jgi:anti-sigma factor RsiW